MLATLERIAHNGVLMQHMPHAQMHGAAAHTSALTSAPLQFSQTKRTRRRQAPRSLQQRAAMWL